MRRRSSARSSSGTLTLKGRMVASPVGPSRSSASMRRRYVSTKVRHRSSPASIAEWMPSMVASSTGKDVTDKPSPPINPGRNDVRMVHTPFRERCHRLPAMADAPPRTGDRGTKGQPARDGSYAARPRPAGLVVSAGGFGGGLEVLEPVGQRLVKGRLHPDDICCYGLAAEGLVSGDMDAGGCLAVDPFVMPMMPLAAPPTACGRAQLLRRSST